MKLLGSPFISILVSLIFSYFMLRYWRLLSQQLLRYRYLLFSLRMLSILCLIFLLLNPWMDWKKKEENPQKVSVICDLSESMFSHLEDYPFQYDEIQKIIKAWGTNNDLNLKFFKLGQKIAKLDNIKSIELTTDFTAIPDFISFEQPNQILLITDGKATAGKNINDIEFKKLRPIHILGVGPVQADEDIEIQDIILPDLLVQSDTVNIKIRIQSRINHGTQSEFQIVNEVGNQIYHERLLFEKGIRFQDLILKMPTDVLNGLNLASIIPIRGETQIENNTFSFRCKLQDSADDILMITGALSQNSRMIEELLADISNVNIHHFFRMDNIRWNEEPLIINYSNLKMIVLDDFPIYSQDNQLFLKIVALSKGQQIPIIYMQGPSGNLISGSMIHSEYTYFVPKAENSNVLMDISTQSSWLQTSSIALEQLPPQKRSMKWIINEKPWLSYIDGSVLIGNQSSFYLVSLPALAESHFKISINSNSIVAQLLEKVFLYAFHGSEGLLSLEVEGKSFNKGAMVQISLIPVKGIDLMDFAVYAVHGTDTLQLECSEAEWDGDISCSTSLLIPGEYTFYAEASIPSGEQVYSNTKSAIVQDVKVEMKELIQERRALMEIAYKTGGTYTAIDSLDTMLAAIDITPIRRVKNHQISGLSSQNYWWILIFLLSIEWYFRKKLGLL